MLRINTTESKFFIRRTHFCSELTNTVDAKPVVMPRAPGPRPRPRRDVFHETNISRDFCVDECVPVWLFADSEGPKTFTLNSHTHIEKHVKALEHQSQKFVRRCVHYAMWALGTKYQHLPLAGKCTV